MVRYIIRRILQAIPLLFLLTIFMFVLIHLLPGGPEQVLFNPHLSAAGRAALRAHFGLDDPVYIQYFKWLGQSLTGNFGFSFANNLPVSEILGQRFPATLELFGLALALALVLAITLGVISAVRQGTVTDYTLTTVSYFGIAMPIFLFGLFAQWLFGVVLHWLPTSGTQTLGYTFTPLGTFIDRFEHIILPMSVLSLTFIAGWSRYMRSSMIEVVKQDYMRTARAKGVGPVKPRDRPGINGQLPGRSGTGARSTGHRSRRRGRVLPRRPRAPSGYPPRRRPRAPASRGAGLASTGRSPPGPG
jgi:peptide/nickel transport system permease protein